MSQSDKDFDAMALLRRASEEEPLSEETRSRVRSAVASALRASVIVPAGTSAGARDSVEQLAKGSGAAGSLRAEGGAPSWLSKFAIWSAPALVVGAAAGVTAKSAFLPSPARRHEIPAIDLSRVPPPSNSTGLVVKETVNEPTVATVEVPPPVPVVAESSSVSKPGGAARELARERALLDQARAQIAAGEPGRALELVDRHERRYAQGALIEEREALAVNALVSLGRYREAMQRGESFRTRYPKSLMMPSVEAALLAIPKQ